MIFRRSVLRLSFLASPGSGVREGERLVSRREGDSCRDRLSWCSTWRRFSRDLIFVPAVSTSAALCRRRWLPRPCLPPLSLLLLSSSPPTGFPSLPLFPSFLDATGTAEDVVSYFFSSSSSISESCLLREGVTVGTGVGVGVGESELALLEGFSREAGREFRGVCLALWSEVVVDLVGSELWRFCVA
jgi:hypothetical protein